MSSGKSGMEGPEERRRVAVAGRLADPGPTPAGRRARFSTPPPPPTGARGTGHPGSGPLQMLGFPSTAAASTAHRFHRLGAHSLARSTDRHRRSRIQAGFADRLSHWLGWTDAISLSAALDGSPAARAVRRSRFRQAPKKRECTRVRAALAKAISRHRHGRARRPTSRPTAGATSPGNRRWKRASAPCAGACARGWRPDRPPWRGLRPWMPSWSRRWVRTSSSLLSTVPALLEKHFERLRQADQAHAGRARWRGPARRVAGRVLQGHAERAARRTGYSIATGRRAARSPSHEPTRVHD